LEAFESWFLRRVARSVEAGGVSAVLLTALQTEVEPVRERSQEEGRAEAVQAIAARLDIPREQAEKSLGAIEVLPTVTRELQLRRFVEAWLEGQREARRSHGAGGSRA
jgi:hypothetical protein